MRYRAICPVCESRLSRRHCFVFPRRDYCDTCHAIIRERLISQWLGSTLVALIFVAPIGLAMVGLVSWWIAIPIAAGIVIGAWIVYPYVTSYDLVTRGPGCPKCGYDLYGLQSNQCPECGADVKDVTSTAGVPDSAHSR